MSSCQHFEVYWTRVTGQDVAEKIVVGMTDWVNLLHISAPDAIT